MAKKNPNFHSDMFRFVHKPIRDADQETFNFLERFLLGPQVIWEEKIHAKILTLLDLINPAKTPQPRLLKDHVGFTKELDYITNDITDDELRKVISLAVALWKTKGTELGYESIVRLFTGANVRIFNWFDFRMIVGEKAFGEEQLGEDAWLISTPGVELSQDEINTVVGLWTFEGSFKDRSLYRNHGIPSGDTFFFLGGPVDGSEKHLFLEEGLVEIQDSVKYDFSGDFTVEGFIRARPLATDGYIFSKKDGAKEISLQYKPTTDEMILTLSDGTNTEVITHATGFDLDDDTWRHWRFVINKTDNDARLYFGGTGSTLKVISAIGDLTNGGSIFIGAQNYGVDLVELSYYDNIRIALNQVNPTASTSIVPPTTSFIEYIEEQLDEFQSDVRVVDDGSGILNKLLLKRVLNLMRPVSERLNIIYVRFSDDFSIGKGNFLTVAGASTVNQITGRLLMPENSFEIVDVYEADNFQDIVYQVKLKIDDLAQAGGLVFNYQDSSNYYYYKMDTGTKLFSLFKVVAGVPTNLAADVLADIVENTDYVLSIQTYKDPFSSDVRIKAFHDSNVIFDLIDTTFYKGRFGLKTEAGSTMRVDEIEMFEQPLETDRIDPGFNS